MEYLWRTVFLVFLHLSLSSPANAKEDKKLHPDHYNVILLGATGDLAKRYLWQALFELFSTHFEKDSVHFSIYGCSLADPDQGRKILGDILLHRIQCQNDEKCREMKKEFVQSSQYHQLKKESHYVDLSRKINENTLTLYGLSPSGNQTTYERGRIIYLSIPPSAYAKSSRLANEHLRPSSNRPWVRLVVEKPFGHDSSSAQKLAQQISKHFIEEEIYRMDHYLGKPVVSALLPFRYINRDLYEPLLNHHHVERVEVAMKESVDAKGRMMFYDEVGIIRDVVQNHLTEMMTLVAMDLPQNSGNISELVERKIKLLREVEPLTYESTLLGQYASFIEDGREELEKDEFVSNTPTFSASVLHIRNSRWGGVPFLLISGKKLEQKFSYIRIVFKNTVYCTQTSDNCWLPRQIVFAIGSNDVTLPPMIAISSALPKPKTSSVWNFEDMMENGTLFGERLSDMTVLFPTSDKAAYATLLQGVFDGQRHMFINTKNLMAAWEIWTPVLKHTANIIPRLYEGGSSGHSWLDFNINGKNLQFVVEQPDIVAVSPNENQPAMAQIPGTFLDRQLESGDRKTVIATLSKHIINCANTAIHEKGSFHLALSGGSTPKYLFQYMTANLPTFPWQQTHIWFVDERCVSLGDHRSNFHLFEEHLLSDVRIPYLNIHPMPVGYEDPFCNESQEGDQIYETTLRRIVPDSKLDYILLGVGKDGHTASLFPGQPSLEENDKLVILGTGGPRDISRERLTLTFKAINQARHIAALVLGSEKHVLIEELIQSPMNITRYPILGVNPVEGNLTWYVDHAALLGA